MTFTKVTQGHQPAILTNYVRLPAVVTVHVLWYVATFYAQNQFSTLIVKCDFLLVGTCVLPSMRYLQRYFILKGLQLQADLEAHSRLSTMALFDVVFDFLLVFQ